MDPFISFALCPMEIFFLMPMTPLLQQRTPVMYRYIGSGLLCFSFFYERLLQRFGLMLTQAFFLPVLDTEEKSGGILNEQKRNFEFTDNSNLKRLGGVWETHILAIVLSVVAQRHLEGNAVWQSFKA